MSIDRKTISVSGLQVELSRKSIKNLHLSVCPPDGRVKLSVPERISEDNARLAVIRKLGWVRKCQREFQEQAREGERLFVEGESHYYDGGRYLLKVEHSYGRAQVVVAGNNRLVLTCDSESTTENRAAAFNRFYREHLKSVLAKCVDRWVNVIGAAPGDIRIQRMKTRWGSCNPDSRRVLLNLELAKKPRVCVEYILVHELVHLIERRHSGRFLSIMEDVMPDWRARRDLLNSLPLAYETWDY